MSALCMYRYYTTSAIVKAGESVIKDDFICSSKAKIRHIYEKILR